MLNDRSKVISIILTVLACGAIGLAGANFVHQHAFKNNIETSGVDIRVDQYHVTESGIEPIKPGKSVTPGEVSSYIPRVTNLRTEGFVRIRMEINMDEEKKKPITVDDVTEVGSDWVRRGDYFYCKKVLGENESSDVFGGIRIPSDWTGETAAGFSVIITADVVQARNFEPDFDSVSPWGSLEIEDRSMRGASANSVEQTDASRVEQTDTSRVGQTDVNRGIGIEEASGGQIRYRRAQAAEKPYFIITENKTFECTTADLFSGFATVMPGDVCGEEMPIRNKTKNKLKVYFRTENVSSDLLHKMNLKIRCGERNVYEGDLVSERLASFMELTVIEPGEQELLQFEIELGRDAKNKYQDLCDDVIWILAIEEEKSGRTAQTGDEQGRILVLMLAICTAMALALLVTLLLGRRR